MMICRIGPNGRATLIVGVIEQALGRAEVAGIDDQLPGRFIIGVSTLAEKPAVAHKEWHAHKDAITPKLMCPAGTGGMPETAIAGARISIEATPDLFRRQLVFFVLRLLIQEQQQI